jgi:hypothetical protein
VTRSTPIRSGASRLSGGPAKAHVNPRWRRATVDADGVIYSAPASTRQRVDPEGWTRRLGTARAAKGGVVLVREEPSMVAAAVGALTEARDLWDRAYRAWSQAVERRDRVISESERRILRATGGLGLDAWEAACRRRRVNTMAEADSVARAVRSRRAAEMAVEGGGTTSRSRRPDGLGGQVDVG